MKCKACHNVIPDGSIFCNLCGERQVKERKKKDEIKVPKPKQLPSGTWWARLTVGGVITPVSGKTEAEYYAKARALKIGLVTAQKAAPKITLQDVIRKYIDSNSETLSPSTIRGYEIVYRNRFATYMQQDIHSIDYQAMINAEARGSAPKTVINAWALVRASLSNVGEQIPRVNLPKAAQHDSDWLDFEQIEIFLAAIRDKPIELAAILALHSLRDSELRALDATDIYDNTIHIRGAMVPDKNNVLVYKDTNKNRTSTRDVPVLIPRLYELLPESGPLVTIHPSSMRKSIERICRANKLPVCSVHDLRRSFASLAYHLGWKDRTTMLVGGWSTMNTVHAVYEKLSSRDQQEDIEKMRNYYQQIDVKNPQ